MTQKHITRRSYLLHTAAVLALILIALVALNLIFSRVTSARWDLTADAQFTLSPATQKLLESLQDRIRIKVFLSPDLPAPDNTLRQRLNDLLAEFEAKAHGKLTFELIEPQSQTDEEVAKGFGLRKVAVSQRDESQRTLRLVFKGMTVIYRDAAETIPELRATDNFEYLIAKSIVNLTAPAQKSVAVLNGFGGLAESNILVESMQTVFAEVFGKRVSVTTAGITDNCTLSTPADALVVLNISRELTPCARYAIEQAVFHGTSLAVFQNPTQGDLLQPDQPRFNIDTKLNEILENAGVQLNADLLLDRTHNIVGTQFTEDSKVPVSLPALPIITALDKSNPITQNLSAIVMPFSGTLSIDDARIASNHAEISRLAISSSSAVARPSGGDIQIEALQSPRTDEIPGPHTLIVALQTPQRSHFTRDTLPPGADAQNFTNSTNRARYLIVPTGDFLFSNKLIGYSDEFARLGIHLFVNGIEWLIQDDALIEIRNRTLPQMFTNPASDVRKRIILLNVAGVPCLVLICFAALRCMRRRRRTKIRRQFENNPANSPAKPLN